MSFQVHAEESGFRFAPITGLKVCDTTEPTRVESSKLHEKS